MLSEIAKILQDLETIKNIYTACVDLIITQERNPGNAEYGFILDIRRDVKSLIAIDSAELETLINGLPGSLSSFDALLAPLHAQKISKLADEILALDLEQLKVSKPENPSILPEETISDYAKRLKASVLDKLTYAQNDTKNYIKNLDTLFSPVYSEMLDKSRIELINGIYPKLIETLQGQILEYGKINDEAEQQCQNLLMKYYPPIEPNSVVVYCWYRPGGKGTKKIFGIDSTGHVSVGVRRKKIIDGKENDETVYVSYFAKQGKEQPSWLGQVAKKIGLPSVDDKIGFFRPLEFDLFALMVGNYGSVESVALDCSEEPCLDIDAIFAEAQSTMSNNDNTFNFYTENCAKMGFRLLKAGKANNIVPYHSYTETVVTSKDVITYAQQLHNAQEQRKLNEKVIRPLTQKSKILQNLAYIKSSIEQAYSKTDTLLEAMFYKEFAAPIVKEINEFVAKIEQEDDMEKVNNLLMQVTHYFNGLMTTHHENVLAKKFIDQHIMPIQEKMNTMFTTFIQEKVKNVIETLETNLRQFTAKDHDITTAIINILQKGDNILEFIHQLLNENTHSNYYQTLLTVTKQLDNLIQIINEDISLLITQFNPETYKRTTPFLTECRAHLQNALGEINQILYFEMTQKIDKNDSNELFLRLYKLFAINAGELVPAPTNVKELVDALLARPIDAVINDLFNNSQLSYSEASDAITRRIKEYQSDRKRLLFSNDTQKLHVQAQLLLTVKAFIEGKIAADEFQRAIYNLSHIAPDNQSKKQLQLFAKSFHVQSILSMMNLEKNNDYTETTEMFKFYDTQQKKMIASKDPQQFLQVLPMSISSSMVENSSRQLIDDSINSIVACGDYWMFINKSTLAEFKEAMRDGFSEYSNSKANKSLSAQYKSWICKDIHQMLPAEAAFLNLYKGIELITDILNHDYSRDEIVEKFSAFKKNRRPYDDRISYSPQLKTEMNYFYDAIYVAAFTKRVKEEAVITDLLSNLDTLSNGKFDDLNNNNIEDQYNLVIGNLNALTTTKNFQAEITDLHNNITNTLAIMQEDDSSQIRSDLRQTLKNTKKHIYFDDKTMRSFLCQFLDRPVSEYTPFDILLAHEEVLAIQEAQCYAGSPNSGEYNIENFEDYYKLVVIRMIKDFLSGKLTEEEFYHALSSYRENNKPPRTLPIWTYKKAYPEAEAKKFEAMHHLRDFTNGFLKKFASVEAKRLDTVSDDRFALSELSTVITNQINPNENSVNGKKIRSRAGEDYQAYNMFSKNNRLYANQLEKIQKIVEKNGPNKLSKEQQIITNLKLHHSTKRMAELHYKRPVIRKN